MGQGMGNILENLLRGLGGGNVTIDSNLGGFINPLLGGLLGNSSRPNNNNNTTNN